MVPAVIAGIVADRAVLDSDTAIAETHDPTAKDTAGIRPIVIDPRAADQDVAVAGFQEDRGIARISRDSGAPNVQSAAGENPSAVPLSGRIAGDERVIDSKSRVGADEVGAENAAA